MLAVWRPWCSRGSTEIGRAQDMSERHLSASDKHVAGCSSGTAVRGLSRHLKEGTHGLVRGLFVPSEGCVPTTL